MYDVDTESESASSLITDFVLLFQKFVISRGIFVGILTLNAPVAIKVVCFFLLC